MVAQSALVARDRVSALILVDTHAGSELPYMKLKYRVLALGVKVVGTRPFLPAIAPMMFGPTTCKTNSTLVREWKARFATVHVPSILHGLGALNRRDSIVHRLNEIDVPSLVIVGEEDTSLPPAYSLQIAEAVTDSSLITISKSGHLSALEQPEAVTTAMLGFLDNLEPQAE